MAETNTDDTTAQYDAEHGKYQDNVPMENQEGRLPTVAFPMAPKPAPFKTGGE
jgi:hypothetical protein